MKGVGGFYYVRASDGSVHACRAAGRFRLEGIKPLVGDWVLFDPQQGKAVGSVREIEPRKNVLIRPPAANVDALVILASAKRPKPDLLLIDKLLIQCEMQGIAPIVCITKCDLDSENAKELAKGYGGAASTAIISATKGIGLEKLEGLIHGKTVCLAGQSATGKSTLLNALCHEQVETGGLSKKTERGRHTTRQAELFWSDKTQGYIMDTPGFSVFMPESIEPAKLASYYPEFAPYLKSCRFTSCVHRAEPDCAVREAVEQGTIDPGRYERYLELLQELEENTAW